MNCWHCERAVDFNFQQDESLKFYYCEACDKWYELRKEKVKVNGAVPVLFLELDARPPMLAAA